MKRSKFGGSSARGPRAPDGVGEWGPLVGRTWDGGQPRNWISSISGSQVLTALELGLTALAPLLLQCPPVLWLGTQDLSRCLFRGIPKLRDWPPHYSSIGAGHGWTKWRCMKTILARLLLKLIRSCDALWVPVGLLNSLFALRWLPNYTIAFELSAFSWFFPLIFVLLFIRKPPVSCPIQMWKRLLKFWTRLAAFLKRAKR